MCAVPLTLIDLLHHTNNISCNLFRMCAPRLKYQKFFLICVAFNRSRGHSALGVFHRGEWRLWPLLNIIGERIASAFVVFNGRKGALVLVAFIRSKGALPLCRLIGARGFNPCGIYQR